MSRVYEVITDRIIKLLEEGVIPWHRPWGGPEDFPRNLVSGKQYRGINAFLLAVARYESPFWLTFKQAKRRGGSVRKGEKGYPCIYWNWTGIEDEETGETRQRPFLKHYTVFNVEQCEDVSYPKAELPNSEFSPIEVCETLVECMPHAPPIEYGGTRAAYDPSIDQVIMPKPELFHSPEDFYSTLFHELIHSTGHASRLARPSIQRPKAFGSPLYIKEELIAEMGAAYLCGHTGIENKIIENSAAYIADWLRRLRKDNRLVIHAAGNAQKASDYILNKQPEGPDALQE